MKTYKIDNVLVITERKSLEDASVPVIVRLTNLLREMLDEDHLNKIDKNEDTR